MHKIDLRLCLSVSPRNSINDVNFDKTLKTKKLKTANSRIYDFSEEELNKLGYQLLRSNRTKDAIEIFKLHIEMFPKSANPYDSLGEAYLANDQKVLALVNYKKAFELDPTNAAAAEIIKRLDGKTPK